MVHRTFPARTALRSHSSPTNHLNDNLFLYKYVFIEINLQMYEFLLTTKQDLIRTDFFSSKRQKKMRTVKLQNGVA